MKFADNNFTTPSYKIVKNINAFVILQAIIMVSFCCYSRGKIMYHQWVKGNIPLCSTCDICSEACGTEPRLSDYQCIWCHRTVHEKFCYCRQEHECDFGKIRELVIPPYCITLKTAGWRGQRKVVVKDVIKPPFEDWKPLLVFTNPKSGGNEGHNLLKVFRGLLNPAQVCTIIIKSCYQIRL